MLLDLLLAVELYLRGWLGKVRTFTFCHRLHSLWLFLDFDNFWKRQVVWSDFDGSSRISDIRWGGFLDASLEATDLLL